MTTDTSFVFDFKQAVTRQFADRPTLRQVASKQILATLLEALPWLAAVTPALDNADPIMLDSPEPGADYWTTAPLLDVVLRAMCEGRALNLEAVGDRHCNLGLKATHRLPGSNSEFDTRQLEGVTRPMNELLMSLPRHLCQAQVGFWRAPGTSGKSRDEWLQLLLRIALIRNLPLQGLDDQQQACVRGLVQGGSGRPPVFLVEVKLTVGGRVFNEMQTGLLVSGEWDERQVVLWCLPCGQVRGYPSLDDFALALRDELALGYHFDSLVWDRHELEGNVFSQQCAVLLAHMFDRMERLRCESLTVAQMEQAFADLSDPAQWFIDGYFIPEAAKLPMAPGLFAASAKDSFAFQQALLQMALDQLESGGRGALDGILDLNSYTQQQLRARMLRDYPTEANYFSDDLLLERVAIAGMPGGAGIGSGGGEPLERSEDMTLTEFAIGNLVSLQETTITGIRHRQGQLIMPWLTVDYLKALVAQVDIGGTYPGYVADALNDTANRSERVGRFAREWRQSLLFTALKARLAGTLTEWGLRCITDFCQGHVDSHLPNIVLIPLAFKRRPDAAREDQVAGMYIVFSAEPAVVLLYRPMYDSERLLEFSSIEAMMEGIRHSDALQQSMLDWMDPTVRPVYDHGGFTEPHITSIGIDPYNLPERPGPAGFAAHLWLKAVDEKLFAANAELLLALARLRATSTAQSRWATLARGAWLLFDLVTLALRGPVASVAWLVQLIGSVDSDVQAIEQGEAFARSAASVDLILNVGMMLLHARFPPARLTNQLPQLRLTASAFAGPPAQHGGYEAARVMPMQGKVGTPGSLSQAVQAGWSQLLDFSWRGNQGFNWLAPEQRRALMAMRAVTDLEGVSPSATGLYEVDGNRYVRMHGEVFAVSFEGGEVRVVEPQGARGPWLSYEQRAWRVDTRLRLRGGMPRVRLDRQFAGMRQAADKLTVEANSVLVQFSNYGKEVIVLQRQVEALEGLSAAEHRKREAAQAEGGAAIDWAGSDRLVAAYEGRIAALKMEMDARRLQAVGAVEQVVRLDREQLGLLDTMLEPKYGAAQKDDYDQVVRQQKALLRTGLIRNTDFVLGELWKLADFPSLNELIQQFEGRPITGVLELYQQFRVRLQSSIELQERMLAMHGTLDELLIEVSGDLDISVDGSGRTVSQLIAERKFTTVDLRFHHVLNLAELALHLDSVAGQRQLVRFKAGLAGKALSSAANAHGESLISNLAIADRISILQEAWDEYVAAIISSLHIERTGGPLVDAELLGRYRLHMQLLKEDAGRRLIDAIAEQEGAAASVAKASSYKISVEPQRVIRNGEGQLIIATEVQQDGQTLLEIRAPVSGTVLQVFVLKDGAWVERLAEAPGTLPTQAPTEDVAAQAQALIDDSQDVLAIAQAYVRDDVSGATVGRLLQSQISKLRAALTLRGGGEGHGAALQAAMENLQSRRIGLLTELYSKTQYPTADALRFLHEQGLIKVEYVRRDTSVASSPFDEFRIIRLKVVGATKGHNLWAAHFHLDSQGALLKDFTRAHLKLWRQRFMGRQYEVASGERVHRGRLSANDVAGIIPLS